MDRLLTSKKAMVALIALGLSLIEAIVGTIFVKFPLITLYGAQVPIVLGFMGLQAASDIKESRYGCQNINIDQRP